jgi:hypothetical protein
MFANVLALPGEHRHSPNPRLYLEIGRTEQRPVGDEAMGVEFASLPSHELFQVEVELRLKNPGADSARSDSATDIGQKVMGIVERDGEEHVHVGTAVDEFC